MTTCKACGCQGHGQTYQIACATCGEDRWPTLPEPPRPGWVCRRCQATKPETREARVSGQRKRVATLRQKAPVTAVDSLQATLDDPDGSR